MSSLLQDNDLKFYVTDTMSGLQIEKGALYLHDQSEGASKKYDLYIGTADTTSDNPGETSKLNNSSRTYGVYAVDGDENGRYINGKDWKTVFDDTTSSSTFGISFNVATKIIVGSTELTIPQYAKMLVVRADALICIIVTKEGPVYTVYRDSHGNWTNLTTLKEIPDYAGHATSASKLANADAIGSTSIPVYFTANGVPEACTAVAVNCGGTGATTAADALKNLGLTATAAEINKLDGLTTTKTELNYVDGVTSSIQAQLDAKLNIKPTRLESGDNLNTITTPGSYFTDTNAGNPDNIPIANQALITVEGFASGDAGGVTPARIQHYIPYGSSVLGNVYMRRLGLGNKDGIDWDNRWYQYITTTTSVDDNGNRVPDNLSPIMISNLGLAKTSHASSESIYGVASASKYGHAQASSTTPKASGAAAVGTETAKFARGDHVHPAQNAFTKVMVGSTTVTADSATDILELVASTNITITADATNDKITFVSADTKNTAGSTNSTSKLFLVGATSQASNPQTYSNENCYALGGYLYSNGSKVLTAHPTITTSADTTTTASPAHGGTFTAVDSITRDSNGHVTKVNTKTVTLPPSGDTDKKTASGNTNSKIFLIGATSQNSAGQTTYSHETVYVGADGCLYSNGTRVGTLDEGSLSYSRTVDSVSTDCCIIKATDSHNISIGNSLMSDNSNYVTFYGTHLYPMTEGCNLGGTTSTNISRKFNNGYFTGTVEATTFKGALNGTATTATTATNLANKPVLAVNNSTKITVTAGEKTSDAFTVPFATSSTTATKANQIKIGSNDYYTLSFSNGVLTFTKA